MTHIFEVYRELADILEREGVDASHAPMRKVILESQLGDLARYISHDPELNKKKDGTVPRPHGSRADEVNTFGHAFIQLASLAYSRGLMPEEFERAIEDAMQGQREGDWKKRTRESEALVAVPGSFTGRVVRYKPIPNGYMADFGRIDLRQMSDTPEEKCVLIVEHFRPDMPFDPQRIGAIITEQGGTTCHAAIVAREYGIPCLVGYPLATAKLRAYNRLSVKFNEDHTFDFIGEVL